MFRGQVAAHTHHSDARLCVSGHSQWTYNLSFAMTAPSQTAQKRVFENTCRGERNDRESPATECCA